MDQLDLIRAYYRALNARDVAEVERMYDSACVTENVFPVGAEEVERGRDAHRRRLEAFFEEYDGNFEDGSSFRVHSIAGNETGWGWVQADWFLRVRGRRSGETRCFRGYSHFLVEDGLIRRQRSVAEETAPADAIVQDASASHRQYPGQPVVGIGGVILVSPAEARRIGWSEPLAAAGVVLIKRRYEPLAGQWSLPGGALEVGETLEAGVAREMSEETGLTVAVGPVVEVFDRILRDPHTRIRYHFVLIDYVCRPLAGRLCAGSDVVDVTIADPDALEPYDLTEKARDVIGSAVKNHYVVEK
jgi:ADP-ribose pyrophosphatase YjhB (NUDIX family)